MSKVIAILVLTVLSLVLAASIFGVDLSEVMRKMSSNKRKPTKDLPTVNLEGYRSTITFADLKCMQLRDDGSVFFEHEINESDMYNQNEMVGIALSHPDANSDGIKLHAKKRNGKYDMSDSCTYNSFTVNTEAIRIGVDDTGYYGVVTNPKAKVYTGTNENDIVEVKFEDTFEIKNGTYVLIGYQWLYFKKVDIKATFPGAKNIQPKRTISNEQNGTMTPRTVFGKTGAMKKRDVNVKRKPIISKQNQIHFLMDDYQDEME